MPSNTAAWLNSKGAPLEVKSAPYPTPAPDEIVVKNSAVAINPIDWAIQDLGQTLFPWLEFPLVLGGDLAGEVVEAGSGAKRFTPGDRVVAHAVGLVTGNSSQRAFQTYTAVPEHMASPLPASLPYERAAVIPLCLSTAACGLFQKDHLALQYPSVPAAKPTGKTLLVWGGATGVGCNAIQLAVAAGYEVIATASPKNFSLVKQLGVSKAFDYNSATVIEDLVHAFAEKTSAGALACARGSFDACAKVVGQTEGAKFVSTTSPLPDKLPSGVGAKFIFASTLQDNEVSHVVYVDFLPKAFAEGTFVASPDPEIVGHGLESIQAGLDAQRKGVSAKKIVVTL